MAHEWILAWQCVWGVFARVASQLNNATAVNSQMSFCNYLYSAHSTFQEECWETVWRINHHTVYGQRVVRLSRAHGVYKIWTFTMSVSSMYLLIFCVADTHLKCVAKSALCLTGLNLYLFKLCWRNSVRWRCSWNDRCRRIVIMDTNQICIFSTQDHIVNVPLVTTR